MPFDDVLDDREPQPGTAERPAATRVDPEKTLRQTRYELGGYPFAMVGHRDANEPAFVLHRNVYRRSRSPISQRVGHDVLEHLTQLTAVTGNKRQISIGMKPQRAAPIIGDPPVAFHRERRQLC